MEEKRRNYVVYTENNLEGVKEQERIVSMTDKQAQAIEWFMSMIGLEGCVELAENYHGEEL